MAVLEHRPDGMIKIRPGDLAQAGRFQKLEMGLPYRIQSPTIVQLSCKLHGAGLDPIAIAGRGQPSMSALCFTPSAAF